MERADEPASMEVMSRLEDEVKLEQNDYPLNLQQHRELSSQQLFGES
jgi:hypothetical protein